MTVKITQLSSIGDHIRTEDAARILDVRPDYIYKLVRIGKLSCVRIGPKQGGTLLFDRREVEELAEAHPNLGKQRRRAS